MRIPQRRRPPVAGDQDPTSAPAPPREAPPGAGAPPRPIPKGGPGAYIRAMRPRQWGKNLLVFAAPAAAGVVFHPADFARCVGAFFIFVAASAATYLVNDVMDRSADRLHPVKRHRPIANGQVTAEGALILAAVLLAASIAGAALLSGVALTAVILAYVVITLAYSLGLKQLAVIELACVASGFILRAVAGGAAVHVPLSPWFLLVASFGALFIVAGKRSSEQDVMGDERAVHRAALGEYTAPFLRMVRTLSAAVAVTAYCLWAFDRASHLVGRDRTTNLVWFELSVIPFVLAVLAVELAIERGRGGEPEELALRDRMLQALGLIWVALLIIGIYS